MSASDDELAEVRDQLDALTGEVPAKIQALLNHPNVNVQLKALGLLVKLAPWLARKRAAPVQGSNKSLITIKDGRGNAIVEVRSITAGEDDGPVIEADP